MCKIIKSISKGFKRAGYFVSNFLIYFSPSCLYRFMYDVKWKKQLVTEDIEKRVDYYCNFEPTVLPEERCIRIRDFKFPFTKKHRLSTYFLDLYNIIVCFNPKNRFSYEFGDVINEQEVPGFVKSRPIVSGRKTNSVVLKLNQLRHFRFIDDKVSFTEKKNMLVARNNVAQPHRILLLEKYFNHPMCDLGQINKEVINGHTEWIRNFMTIDEQLQYKFISCIEGNDVATNLKWVMSSNSLPVMPEPKYETWFMEGTLIPDYHYVCVKPDYSDLIEKMNYYIANPDKAEEMIRHNHEYIRQFQDKRKEKLISLLVVDKYLRCTNQK